MLNIKAIAMAAAMQRDLWWRTIRLNAQQACLALPTGHSLPLVERVARGHADYKQEQKAQLPSCLHATRQIAE